MLKPIGWSVFPPTITLHKPKKDKWAERGERRAFLEDSINFREIDESALDYRGARARMGRHAKFYLYNDQ